MVTRTRKRKFHGPPAKTYAKLVSVFPPRPLHDATDYDNAVEMVGQLAGYELNADQADYLEALATFIEKYEAEHDETQVDTRGRKGVVMLKRLMEQHDMNGADLSRLLGLSRLAGPMILRGERNITAEHARKLGQHFKMEPGAFIEQV